MRPGCIAALTSLSLVLSCGSDVALSQRKPRATPPAPVAPTIVARADIAPDTGSAPRPDATADVAGNEAPTDAPTDASLADAGVADAGPPAEPPLFVPTSIEDPGGKAMARFHAALRRAERGEGQARIAFYGASHTASDLFTGVIRSRLQQRFGEAGPGFVVPAKPWRWYRHSGFRFERSRGWDSPRVRARAPKHGRYGLAGVALESGKLQAQGIIETRARDGLEGTASLFELYYLTQPQGGDVLVFMDGKRIDRIKTAAEGFSTAYARFEVPLGHHKFELRTQANGPVRVFGVAVERPDPGVVLDTLGIPGARSRYHLKWDDAVYREHLARRAPDLIVLAYGTNEAGDDDVPIEDYEARGREVWTRIKEVAPGASCLLVGPSDRPIREDDLPPTSRPRTAQIVEAQRKLAAEFGCGFFDVVAFMGGDLSMVRWVQADPPFGAPDHVHYTRRGYEALGHMLHDALLVGYDGPGPD